MNHEAAFREQILTKMEDRAVRQRRFSVLLSAMPEIPPDFCGAILTERQTLELRDRLRKEVGVCGLCGCGAVRGNLDHLIPRSRGGANTATNLILTCTRCNVRKGSLTGEEFLRNLLRATRTLRRRLRRHLATA